MVEPDFEDLLPLGSFALIADIQYANIDDGKNFDSSKIRSFRQALRIAAEACEYYCSTGKSYSFGVALGDIIDLKSHRFNMVDECLEAVKCQTQRTGIPWHYLVGNHDLFCLSRESIRRLYLPDMPETATCDASRLYYTFTAPGLDTFRFIVLDPFEWSWVGAATPALKMAAIEALKRNPNLKYNATKDAYLSSDWLTGLKEEEMMFVPVGGGLGPDQLIWLQQVVNNAADRNEKCIVFSHLPCYRGCTSKKECCMFNCDEVLAVLHSRPRTVVAFFAGHDHNGGYDVDVQGIHHLVPPAPIDCVVGDTAFADVTLFRDHLQFAWFGSPPPAEILARPWPTEMYFDDN